MEMKQRENSRFIEERKNKDGKFLCLVPTCNNLREKYKRSDKSRNYCKEHGWEDMRGFTNWQELRMKALKRDKYTCINCGYKDKAPYSELRGDHIKPISLGGDEWDLDNIQTLCVPCDKKKTKKDIRDISIERNLHKEQKRLIGNVDFKERERFIDWLQSKKLTYKSIMNYLFYYDKFRSAQNMNQTRVNSFLKKYKHNSIVKAFVNNYRTFILTNEKDYKKELINAARSILIPKETGGKSVRVPDFIMESEVWKMEKYFERERDKLMLLLSFYCGVRLGGLINIRPHSFNWEEWDSVKSIGKLRVIEKGDKERIVIVPSKLMFRIENWIKMVAVKKDTNPKNPLFKIGARRWAYLLESCSERVLNKAIHPHTLRHSFATHLLNKGIKIERVQRLLGHKDISSTQIYTHIVQKDLEEDYAKLVDY